jgi:hypothetical protein
MVEAPPLAGVGRSGPEASAPGGVSLPLVSPGSQLALQNVLTTSRSSSVLPGAMVAVAACVRQTQIGPLNLVARWRAQRSCRTADAVIHTKPLEGR